MYWLRTSVILTLHFQTTEVTNYCNCDDVRKMVINKMEARDLPNHNVQSLTGEFQTTSFHKNTKLIQNDAAQSCFILIIQT